MRRRGEKEEEEDNRNLSLGISWFLVLFTSSFVNIFLEYKRVIYPPFSRDRLNFSV